MAYGAAIAGEASLVLSVEDVHGELESTEVYTHQGETLERRVMNVDKVIGRLVDTWCNATKKEKTSVSL